MSLDNNTIQNPLPGDLQARVENALNQVSSLELEITRLDKLSQLKKSELQNIHNEFKALEASIQSATANKLALDKEVATASSKLNELQYAIKDVNHELEEAAKLKKEVNSFVETQKKDLADRIKRVEELESEIDKRLAELHSKEVTHQSKVDKLLAALK